MRSLLIFFGIFAFVGTVTLLLSLFFGYQSVVKVSSWEEAPASYTGLDWGGNSTIEFSYQGQLVRFYSSFTSSDMEVGQTMQVHFPPGKPNEAEIKNFFELWFLPLFFQFLPLSLVVSGSMEFRDK